MMDFRAFFTMLTGITTPYSYQYKLGVDSECKNRLVRIPTGFGKTLAAVCAWIYNRLYLGNQLWPRRLVYCCPRRSLTIQIAIGIREILAKIGMNKIRVHVLMGGESQEDWHLNPEDEAIIIGTQDMLVSRAMNRGYACGRARWPMECGLLNQDSLWIFDEIQLMDVGLITAVQLHSFRSQDKDKLLRPTYSWLMSATLQPAWLKTIESNHEMNKLEREITTIPKEERHGGLWDIKKSIEFKTVNENDATRFCDLVINAHLEQEDQGYGCITKVFCNTIDRAKELAEQLIAKKITKVYLIHSKFCGKEKEKWISKFLSKNHCKKGTNFILITTQISEAGTDISAGTVITEMAPWASLIQRFGRCARYGGVGRLIIVEYKTEKKKAEKKAWEIEMTLPYNIADVKTARAALKELDGGGIKAIEEFEEGLSPERLAQLYPYSYKHLLMRSELEELFDTTLDLNGEDTDISRFVRSGDNGNIFIFWIPGTDTPEPEMQPMKRALCPSPISATKKWLFKDANKCLKFKKQKCAWCWDYTEGRWELITKENLIPGAIVAVPASIGGYSTEFGLTMDPPTGMPVPVDTEDTIMEKCDLTDMAEAREDRSQDPYQTIAFHGSEAVAVMRHILDEIADIPANIQHVLTLAAILHDWGKCHPAFATNIKGDNRPDCSDLAKAPSNAWVHISRFYGESQEHGPRKGLRHELASTIACLEYLRERKPLHSALLGNFEEWITAGIIQSPTEPKITSDPLGLVELSEDDFNLLIYLICSHHGKVRGRWRASLRDMEFPEQNTFIGMGRPIRGIRNGDILPECRFIINGDIVKVPGTELNLDAANCGLGSRYGKSWIERINDLMKLHGPFTLSYLECLIRAADCRGSQSTKQDPILGEAE